jgi:hypothetical protein
MRGEQQAHQVKVAIGDRQVQGPYAVTVGTVGVSSGLEQKADSFAVLPVEGPVERWSSILARQIDVDV